MKTFSTVASLAVACGLLGGCDNTRANPAGHGAVESPSPQVVLGPGVAPTSASPPVAAPTLSRSDTYTDDFDADGIADTRTSQTWTYDPVSRQCTSTTEIDFDADGTIDSRSVATSANAAAC